MLYDHKATHKRMQILVMLSAPKCKYAVIEDALYFWKLFQVLGINVISLAKTSQYIC